MKQSITDTTTLNLLRHINKGAKLDLSLAILAEDVSKIGTFHSTAYVRNATEKDHTLMKRIEQSTAKKLISEQKQLDNNTDFSEHPLASYFTKNNKEKSSIVAIEEEFILNNNYELTKAYYIPYAIPPGVTPIRKIVFLITSNINEAQIAVAFLKNNPYSPLNN